MTAPRATEIPLADPPVRALSRADAARRRLGERDARERQLDLVRRVLRARSAGGTARPSA